mgnify:CR=1 FL=1
MRTSQDADFGDLFFEPFEATLSDDSSVELFEGGADDLAGDGARAAQHRLGAPTALARRDARRAALRRAQADERHEHRREQHARGRVGRGRRR